MKSSCVGSKRGLKTFFFYDSATLSPAARQQLTKLLKQDHNEETLRTFTLLHLPDFPLFLQQTFGEFRLQYFPRERVSC